MSDEHQPTEGDMREQFVAGAMVTGFAYSRDEAGDDWANWLEAHDREIAAEALEAAARIVADVARQGGGLQTAEQALIREAARLHATNLNGDAS